jgi:hypothetical protein
MIADARNRSQRIDRRTRHGQHAPCAVAGLEDLPAQSRRRNRFDRYIRGAHDLVRVALRVGDSSPRAQTNGIGRGFARARRVRVAQVAAAKLATWRRQCASQKAWFGARRNFGASRRIESNVLDSGQQTPQKTRALGVAWCFSRGYRTWSVKFCVGARDRFSKGRACATEVPGRLHRAINGLPRFNALSCQRNPGRRLDHDSGSVRLRAR